MSLEKTPLSNQTKEQILLVLQHDPEKVFFANPNVMDIELCTEVIKACPRIFEYLQNSVHTFDQSILTEENTVRIRAVKSALLSALTQLTAYTSIENELKSNPQYLEFFAPHEIPNELVNVALKASPALMFSDAYEFGYDFNKSNYQALATDPSLIRYFDQDALPREFFVNAVKNNKYALYDFPDFIAKICIDVLHRQES